MLYVCCPWTKMHDAKCGKKINLDKLIKNNNLGLIFNGRLIEAKKLLIKSLDLGEFSEKKLSFFIK